MITGSMRENAPECLSTNHNEAFTPSLARSLFIISLPRSQSGLLYQRIRATTRLSQPNWTSDGEILNLDRHVLRFCSAEEASRKYVSRDLDGDVFGRSGHFLDHVFRRTGYLYKDVVQPFIVSEFLRANADVPVLRIKRNIADVAYSMLKRGWNYPARVAKTAPLEPALIEGLIAAEAALDSVPSHILNFDSIIDNEADVRLALIDVYPHLDLCHLNCINDRFISTRKEVIARRDSVTHHRRLCNLLDIAKSKTT